MSPCSHLQLYPIGSGEPKGWGWGDNVNILSYLGFSKITGQSNFPYRGKEG